MQRSHPPKCSRSKRKDGVQKVLEQRLGDCNGKQRP